MRGRIRFGLLGLVLLGITAGLCGGCITGAVSSAERVVLGPEGAPVDLAASGPGGTVEP